MYNGVYGENDVKVYVFFHTLCLSTWPHILILHPILSFINIILSLFLQKIVTTMLHEFYLYSLKPYSIIFVMTKALLNNPRSHKLKTQ